MLPLSFRESCSGFEGKGLHKREKFDAYLRYSSFPYTLRLPEGGPEVRQYLTDLSTQSKYYAVDVTLRNTLVQGSDSDIGHILENVVYLELLRRAGRAFVGELDDGEVDFVVEDENGLQYFQVAATTLDESVLARELAPLQKIPDNYPKFLLTLDDVFATADYEGIKKVNVLDWLLEDV